MSESNMPNTSLVAGSTGLVGKNLLIELSKKNDDVIALTRRSINDLPINVKTLQINFDSSLEDQNFPSCDHLYICLGTTIRKAGSQEEFKKVDFEYSLSIAKKAYEAGATKISLVSSVGANPNSKNFYLRVKGELEEAIKNIDYEQINIYRPSLLIGTRSERRFLEQLGQNFSFLINFLLWGALKKYRSVKVEKLSKNIASSKVKNGINYYYLEDFIELQ
jgi:uncharacterized protein YbjT (DUF2867 family)|tara:strand:- start:1233 stop:1892 length:660 start_codon:yes stop_codon:yes gene_type:complete